MPTLAAGRRKTQNRPRPASERHRLPLEVGAAVAAVAVHIAPQELAGEAQLSHGVGVSNLDRDVKTFRLSSPPIWRFARRIASLLNGRFSETARSSVERLS